MTKFNNAVSENVKANETLLNGMNSIMVTRSKLFVPKGNSELDVRVLATGLKNIEDLGFTFSEKLINRMKTLSQNEFVILYKFLVRELKLLVGAYVDHRPMFENFPEETKNMDQAELYLKQILHYLTRKTFGEEKQERFPLLQEIDRDDLRVIDLAEEEDFYELIKNLIESKTSISADNKADIEWAIKNVEVSKFMPEEIPMKENVAFVSATLLKEKKATTKELQKFFKTQTDIFRLCVALSGGDVSLAEKTEFKSFPNSQRKFVMELLENSAELADDIAVGMKRNEEGWKVLAGGIHPFEKKYRNRFPKAQEAFRMICNSEAPRTFNAKVEMALVDKNIPLAVALLKTNPGEFARRLNHLLTIGDETNLIIESFRQVATKVSTPVLQQVMTYFKHRNDDSEIRPVMPKGNVQKIKALENNLPKLNQEVCDELVDICHQAMLTNFSELEPLGKVYVDKELKNYVVPNGIRSASKSLKTLVRGSRIPMGKGDTIRAFLYWHEGFVNGVHTDTVDIDLSSVMFDTDWNYMEHVSYTNLRSEKYQAYHSGDFVEAPNGASEFIDIDIPSVLKYGGRYIMLNLYSYNGHPYCNLPECFAGWMMREGVDSGEVFEAKTVSNKIDLASDTRISVPVILDLQEREVIWCDLALTYDFTNDLGYSFRYRANNVENNINPIILMGKAMTSLKKPNLYDLFMLHGLARGEIVEEIQKADKIFSTSQGITPYDIEEIMAKYM